LAAVPSIGRADAPAASPEADAASRLYELYYDRIYGYCLYHLGNREEAEDAAQTTFLNAFRGLRRGVVPNVEWHWLVAIAKNACLVRHRTRGRRAKAEVLRDPQVLEDAFCGPQAIVDDLLPLEDALERMPEQQRRAILLREWKGLSYREIAAEMGLSISAVETLIFRARRSLAQLLEGEADTRSRRRLKHGFDFGSLAAALKSALAGGSAVKLAATAAALAAAAFVATPIVSPGKPRSAARAVHASAATSASVERAEEAAGRNAVATAQAASRELRERPRAVWREKAAPSAPSGAGPKDSPSSPSSAVDKLGGTVDEVSGTGSGAVQGLPSQLRPLPEAPTVEVPDAPPGVDVEGALATTDALGAQLP
jgi:RNA polymerase sigma-70 factor (ECF subfamily)